MLGSFEKISASLQVRQYKSRFDRLKPYTNISITDAISTLFFYFSIHPRRSAHTWLSITETASSLGKIRIVFIYSKKIFTIY